MKPSLRYYRQGVKARQEKRQRYECKYPMGSVRYESWMMGWGEEDKRLSGEDETSAVFTDVGAAISEAEYMAEQHGYAYALCSNSDNNLIVKPLHKASYAREEVLEIINPLAKFSG